jgi:hypothetical protein
VFLVLFYIWKQVIQIVIVKCGDFSLTGKILFCEKRETGSTPEGHTENIVQGDANKA